MAVIRAPKLCSWQVYSSGTSSLRPGKTLREERPAGMRKSPIHHRLPLP